ncbi:MAG TPA: hypothetical protein DE316_09055 [Eubacterium sp.]|nr:hypothetical protein [Eubacterium sp.]
MKNLQLCIVSIWLLICIYYIPYSIIYKNLKSLKFVTVALTLQNIMSLFACNSLPGYVVSFIILYKEIILWGTVIWTLIIRQKIRKNNFSAICFVFYLVLSMFRGNVDIYTKFVCFRQLMTPVILILYGRCLNISQDEKVDFLKFIINMGVFQAIFGIVEEFILGDKFWLALNISSLFKAKGFSRWVIAGMPGNYYSADFYSIIGRSVRRLVGITTDPLLTAHFLAFCIVILLFLDVDKKNKKIFKIVLLSIATFLTLSKGAILIVAISFLYKVWIKNRKVAIFLIVFAITGLVGIIQSNILRTVSIHLAGLTTAAESISIIGGGIGTSGNLASLGGKSTTSGESFFGMILGQLGIIGLLLFIWMIKRMTKLLFAEKNKIYVYAIIAYIIAITIEAIVSESAINFVGSGVAFIALGIFSVRKNVNKNKGVLL